MTTMFVQLRHVVYLLVLLQYCACVAYANETEEYGNETVEENVAVNETRKVELAEKNLTDWTEIADELLVDGRSCLVVWEKEVELCKENFENTESAINRTDVLLKEIDAKKKPEVQSDNKDALFELVKRANESIRKIKETIPQTISSFKDTSEVRRSCYYTIGNLETVTTLIQETLLFYSPLLENETFRTPDRVRVAENSNATYNAMSSLMVKLKGTNDRGEDCVQRAEELVRGVNKKLKEEGKYQEVVSTGEVSIEASTNRSSIRTRLAEARKEETRRIEQEKEAAKQRLVEEELAGTAKREIDRSDGPALVHSSLILLVLSVLGCTLVC